MKTLITIALLLSACTKQIPIPETKEVKQETSIQPSYANQFDNQGKTTKEFIKSNTWPVTASEWSDKQGCGQIIVFIRPHVIQILNPTHEEYLKYPIGSKIEGEQIYQWLNNRNYWK